MRLSWFSGSAFDLAGFVAKRPRTPACASIKETPTEIEFSVNVMANHVRFNENKKK